MSLEAVRLLPNGGPCISIGGTNSQAAFVEKNQAMALETYLSGFEFFPKLFDSLRLALFGENRLFLCVNPRCLSAPHTEVMHTNTPVCSRYFAERC